MTTALLWLAGLVLLVIGVALIGEGLNNRDRYDR